MKRMYKLLFIMLIGSVPFSMAFGQEKKNEQKIKVIINDGSGEKTIIDTTFTGGTMPEKINLKNGKVIYIGESGTGMTHISTGEGTEKVFVTVTSEGDEKKDVEKKVIIMSSDSVKWTAKPGEKQVYVYSSSKSTGLKPGSKDGADDIDSDMETKYVIAKDGMVITVEGKDEAKAKEIINLIENKLNIKSESVEKKVVVKTDKKNTVKK
jgi:hypothetical protein